MNEWTNEKWRNFISLVEGIRKTNSRDTESWKTSKIATKPVHEAGSYGE